MGIQINGQTDTVTATDGSINVGGDVTIPGVLTYEDVTNVDSVGIGTFRNGIDVTGGTSAFAGRVNVGASNLNNRALNAINASTTVGAVSANNHNANGILFQGYNTSVDANNASFVVQSNGSTGIGTAVPDASLHIHRDDVASFDAIWMSGSTKRKNVIKVNNSDNLIIGVDENDEGNDSNFRLQIDGSEKLRITSNGSVGVGTATPGDGTLIDVVQQFGRTRISKYGHILSQNTGASFTEYWTLAPRTSGEFDIGRGTPDGNGTIANTKFRITPAGVVQCGTASTLKAEINNGVSGHQFISQCSDNNNGFEVYQQHGSNTTRNNLAVYANTGGSNAKHLQFSVRGDGNVGINTTAPQSRLEVFTDDDNDFGNSSNTNNTNSLIRLFNKNGTDNTAVNNYVGIRFDVANGATSTGYLSYVRTGNNTGAFQFKARNAANSYPEVARILSSGGITFGGDTAQDNALDDYEEGTLDWRLQRNNAVGSGSNVSDTKVTYTKVGNRVYVSGYIYTQNTGNSTGVLAELRDNSNVSNYATLPYVPNQAGGFPITGTRTLDDSYRNMAVTFRQGQSQVYIYNDDGNNAYLKNSNNVNIGSSQTHLVIQFCGSYTTNS